MPLKHHIGKYSGRGWLAAFFIVAAMVLGGGGSPNPATELILQLVFVAFALAWIWLGKARFRGATDRLILGLIALVAIVPIIQLVPLPPSLWTGLPGREGAVAALALVGEEGAWRPISLSPARTLASLLAMAPPLFCLYAMAKLDLRDRRLVLSAIVSMAIFTVAIGSIQLTASGQGLSFYSAHHVGWITGFQANRNATADVLLIGLLALAILVAPYLAGKSRRAPLKLSRKAIGLLSGALAVLFIASIAMTGSRTGTALLLAAFVIIGAILSLARNDQQSLHLSPKVFAALAAGLAVLATITVVYGQDLALGRIMNRFSALQDTRGNIWDDTWFALKQYWPVGFGMGGFEPAMLAAERLEYLDPTIPNRAHNDFLELGLEAGAFGYAVLALAATTCLAMAWRSWRAVPAMRDQIVFGLGVLLLVAIHSVVDYPLRSMAVSILTSVAVGVLARTRPLGSASAQDGQHGKMKGPA